MGGNGGTERVLVGYTSFHGATRGIAERVAERLREHGCPAEAPPVARAGKAADHGAVVLGSPVHDRAWTPEAMDYARRGADDLARRPVWLFSVGPARVLGGRYERRGREPRGIPELRRRIRPRGHRLFAATTCRRSAG